MYHVVLEPEPELGLKKCQQAAQLVGGLANWEPPAGRPREGLGAAEGARVSSSGAADFQLDKLI